MWAAQIIQKKNRNNSYSKYRQAGQKVPQRSHFYAKKKKKSFLSVLAAINFLDATSFDAVHLHSGELQAGAGAFIPSGSKGTTPSLATKKSRICEEEEYFETKIKRRTSVEQWNGKGHRRDKNCRRNEGGPAGLFKPNPQHTMEPTEQWFVLEGFLFGEAINRGLNRLFSEQLLWGGGVIIWVVKSRSTRYTFAFSFSLHLYAVKNSCDIFLFDYL